MKQFNWEEFKDKNNNIAYKIIPIRGDVDNGVK